MRFVGVLGVCSLLGLGCSKAAPVDETPSPNTAGAVAIAPEPKDSDPPETCEAPIPLYEDGRVIRAVCPKEVSRAGLTVIDLSDEWAPLPFADAPGDDPGPTYRDTFVALANERLGDGPEFDRARTDRYLELYGIFPSFSVVRARLADDARHACHDAVDDAALEKLSRPLDPWREIGQQRSDKAFARTLRTRLEAERKRRGASSIDELEKDPYMRATYAQYQRVGVSVEAIAAAQAHLRCDGLLSPKAEPGVLDYSTTLAMKAFHRKHMIVSWRLDDETRRALLADSRELDMITLLRVLRERVFDATGILEDGSARGETGKVSGRTLDADAFRTVADRGPIDGGAPDLLSEATDAAARALGWTTPDRVSAFFDALGETARSLKVAVKLPPVPVYHAREMGLRVEIDRGDVWYDFPFTKNGEPRNHVVNRRPTLVLYAKHGDRETAVVRWPTTIGGWKPERLGRRKLGMVYKDSPEGSRVWRDLIVSPVWVPPESAPKRDLVRPRPGGGWAVKQDVFGPGYASAYGLLMLVHHRVAQIKNAKDPLVDQGIRTHGSVSYDSIHHGTSHGCHRLFNHMAIRLGGFLLAHRKSVRHGAIPLGYGRAFTWEGKVMKLSFDARGYRYELDPPVPVEVLRGRVMGQASPILEAKPLPESLAQRFTQEMFED